MSGTKRQGYQVSERFFNIWYLMRNAPRGARARVGWLVEFIRLWFSNNELQSLAHARWHEHRDGLYCDGPALEYSRAIAHAMPEDAQARRQLEWAVFREARKRAVFGELFELQGEDADYSTPNNYLERFETLREALMLTPLPEREKSVWVREVTSALHLTLAEKETVAKDCENATAEKIIEIRTALSGSRGQLIKLHDANSVEQVEDAAASGNFFPDCPNATLALTQMLDCFGESPNAFVVALALLAEHHHDASVEMACKNAMELAPDNARPWNTLGDCLSPKPNQSGEAESAYRKAIDLDPAWANPWSGLGDLLSGDPKRYDEAESAYRKAIALNPQLTWAWGCLGDILNNDPQRHDEAESAYHKAIELNPKWESAWSCLGYLLSKNPKRHDEAESAYRKAIELEPQWANPWGSLGCLLSDDPNRHDEAESAYRKVIELDPQWVTPWDSLSSLLRNDPNRYEEAETAFRKAIELDPTSIERWNILGDFLQDQLKQYDKAEQAYRMAIERDALNPYPIVNLARLLARLNRDDEASELFRQTVQLAKKDNQNVLLQAHCWLGNSDLAMQALDALAELASNGNDSEFYQLKEQCFECHAIGLSIPLYTLMERSRFAGFLQPFVLALRAANGEKDALLDVAVEVRGMAEEVLRKINGAP